MDQKVTLHSICRRPNRLGIDMSTEGSRTIILLVEQLTGLKSPCRGPERGLINLFKMHESLERDWLSAIMIAAELHFVHATIGKAKIADCCRLLKYAVEIRCV